MNLYDPMLHIGMGHALHDNVGISCLHLGMGHVPYEDIGISGCI